MFDSALLRCASTTLGEPSTTSLAQIISTRSKVLLVFDLMDSDLHDFIKRQYGKSPSGFPAASIKVGSPWCFAMVVCRAIFGMTLSYHWRALGVSLVVPPSCACPHSATTCHHCSNHSASWARS
jgi:hypothetical protein